MEKSGNGQDELILTSFVRGRRVEWNHTQLIVLDSREDEGDLLVTLVDRDGDTHELRVMG